MKWRFYCSENFLLRYLLTMENKKVAQSIALIDILLATFMLGYAASQWSHSGVGIIPGAHFSYGEKVTRFTIYVMFVSIMILIQLGMAINLLYSATKMHRDPVQALRNFQWWREWSVVFILFLLLDLVIVVTVMKYGERKIIIFTTLSIEILFRPFGIYVVGKYKCSMESENELSKV